MMMTTVRFAVVEMRELSLKIGKLMNTAMLFVAWYTSNNLDHKNQENFVKQTHFAVIETLTEIRELLKY